MMDKLSLITQKIIPDTELDRQLAVWRFKEFRIVFTNGCFDILHRGHLEYLVKASELGDVLILGLNTDRSVRRIKGPNRPVQDELSRAMLLASLNFITAVVLFDEDTPEKLIKRIQPDILVKGADYEEKEVVGYDFVKTRGGKIITIDLVPGQSTSEIIQKLKTS